jgi:regulatory protein
MLRPAQHDKGNARDYALRLLAIRPRSVREMRDRLARKGFEKQALDSTIAELAELGLLDDRKFAAQWIESRMALRPMGLLRLRAELLAKGVDREVVESVLRKNRIELDEKSAALALAQKKLRSLQGLEPEAARRRLAEFLGRRGFAAETVSLVLKEMSRKGGRE